MVFLFNGSTQMFEDLQVREWPLIDKTSDFVLIPLSFTVNVDIFVQVNRVSVI